MVITDLKKAQQAKARTSNRKHEGVRNPKARNTIIRDREDDTYHAVTDGGELRDLANEIMLRLNALELNVSKLKRDDAVSRGAAAPITIAEAVHAEVVKASDNVVPMDVARKAKEQSKAVPATSSPGNEAETLQVLPVPSAEPPLKVANVEPKYIGKVAPTSSGTAANDGDYDDNLTRVMRPEDLGYVEALASQYQLTLVEASEILYRAWDERNKHCLKKHGQPREVVRLERAIRKPRAEHEYVHPGACQSRFKDWWAESEALVHAVKRMPKRVWSVPKLTKREQDAVKKALIKRMAARQKGPIPGLKKINVVARRLYVNGPGPTTDSQLKLITTAGWDLYQRGRKLFGLQPTLRSAHRRAKEEFLAEYVQKHTESANGGGGTVHGPLTAADYETKQAELVRRYQRTGIGY